MIEMKVAHGHGVHGLRVETRGLQRRQDPQPFVAAHGATLVADPLPYPRLHEHAPRRRLHEQAVERLQQAVILVDLAGNEVVPHHARNDAEQCPGVRAERARLDQRDARSSAEFGRPVDCVVEGRHGFSCPGAPMPRRPLSKSWW